MKVSHDDIRRRFRERGLKATPQRAAIYRALAETTCHPTADVLYRAVRRIHPMISPNTVYYTLAALKAAGLVHEVNYWHDGARFDANMEPHHHLICVSCRRIDDVTDRRLDALLASMKPGGGFDVVGRRVEFHGYCDQCVERRRRAKRGKNRSHASSS